MDTGAGGYEQARGRRWAPNSGMQTARRCAHGGVAHAHLMWCMAASRSCASCSANFDSCRIACGLADAGQGHGGEHRAHQQSFCSRRASAPSAPGPSPSLCFASLLPHQDTLSCRFSSSSGTDTNTCGCSIAKRGQRSRGGIRERREANRSQQRDRGLPPDTGPGHPTHASLAPHLLLGQVRLQVTQAAVVQAGAAAQQVVAAGSGEQRARQT